VSVIWLWPALSVGVLVGWCLREGMVRANAAQRELEFQVCLDALLGAIRDRDLDRAEDVANLVMDGDISAISALSARLGSGAGS